MAKRLSIAKAQTSKYWQLENVTAAGVREISRCIDKGEGLTCNILSQMVETGLAFRVDKVAVVNTAAFKSVKSIPYSEIQLKLMSNENVLQVWDAVRQGAKSVEDVCIKLE